MCENEQILADENVKSYISNPLNTFLMIKLATVDMWQLQRRIPEKSKEFLKRISKFQPNKKDLIEAVRGLLHLQAVYKLRSADLANGIIDTAQTRKELSAHDLFVIGEEAFRMKGHDYFVKEYFSLAWEKIKKGFDSDREVDEKMLLLLLCDTYNRTGDYDNAITAADEFLKNNPSAAKFANVKRFLLRDRQMFGRSKMLQQVYPYSDDFLRNGRFSEQKERILYRQVCRGNVTKSFKELGDLNCRFVSNSAYSKLGPFKLEEVNLEPYIVKFIDVLSNSEIDYFTVQTRKSSKAIASGNSKKLIPKREWHFSKNNEISSRIYQCVEVKLIIIKLH